MRRGIVGALLTLVPAGYFAVAADLSHSVAAAREISAERAGLVGGVPSSVQQAIYRVPVPPQAGDAAFYETNSWTTDALYVQFTTTQDGLADFLRRLGVAPAELRVGLRAVTVPAGTAAKVPWTFPTGRRWAGIALPSRSPQPSREITVNLDVPDRPAVFVTSVIRFVR